MSLTIVCSPTPLFGLCSSSATTSNGKESIGVHLRTHFTRFGACFHRGYLLALTVRSFPWASSAVYFPTYQRSSGHPPVWLCPHLTNNQPPAPSSSSCFLPYSASPATIRLQTYSCCGISPEPPFLENLSQGRASCIQLISEACLYTPFSSPATHRGDQVEQLTELSVNPSLTCFVSPSTSFVFPRLHIDTQISDL